MVEMNLDGYDRLRSSGIGGNAAVYKLCNKAEGHVRALRETVIGKDDEASFMEHCRLSLRLGNGCHPYIIRTYGYDIKDGKGRVLMDYIPGQSLTAYFRENQGLMPIDEVIRLLNEIGSALAFCHYGIYNCCYDKEADALKDDPSDGRKAFIDEKTKRRLVEKYRIIHNDVHTGNIMRRDDGGFVLLDFDRAYGLEVRNDAGDFNAGAPEFVAPEKLGGRPGFERMPQTDVYGFGAVLYQALTGRPPYMLHKNMQLEDALLMLRKEQETSLPAPVSVLRKKVYEETHPGEEYQRDCPEWLEGMVMRCLDRDPSKRYADCKELHDELIRHLRDDKGYAAFVSLPVVAAVPDGDGATELPGYMKGGDDTVIDGNNAELENAKVRMAELQHSLDESLLRIETLGNENERLRNANGKKKGGLWMYLALLFMFVAAVSSGLYLSGGKEKTIASGENSSGEDPAAVVEQKEAEIAQKDADIERLGKEVEKKDAEIAQKDAKIKQQDKEIKQKENEIKQKDAKIKELEKKKSDAKTVKKSSGNNKTKSIGKKLQGVAVKTKGN
jgi:serine/threonine protein kinase